MWLWKFENGKHGDQTEAVNPPASLPVSVIEFSVYVII